MQTEILKSRVFDLQKAAFVSGAPRFLGFLSPEEATFVKSLPKNGTEFSFFGGFEDAERVFLCVCAQESLIDPAAYPIEPLTISYRACDKLSHRDFLGALLSKGIKRETVGDILIESGRAVLFVARDISKYLIEQTTEIGRVGVSIKRGAEFPLPNASEKVEITHTVASLRLDCVVAALISASREKSAKIIADSFVSVNSVITQKATKIVAVGDKISVRGFGKFTVISADGITRKGRTVLITQKYK